MANGEIDKVFAGLNNRGRKFQEEVILEFMVRVKARTPVRTGHLQNSWGAIKRQSDVEIYNTADYAEHVEYGTDRQAPRGMLRATLLEMPEIMAIAAERAKKK